MRTPPEYKVYLGGEGKKKGEYIAACKYREDAAILATASNCRVYMDHKYLLWDNAVDDPGSVMSADGIAATMAERKKEIIVKCREIWAKNIEAMKESGK